jgi:AhpD family alkylhydroperoxidase
VQGADRRRPHAVAIRPCGTCDATSKIGRKEVNDMANTKSTQDLYREIEEVLGRVPTWLRDVPESGLAGFWGLMKDFHLAETAIPNKYKELIGLAVSGATRCKYCALFHTETAKMFGASDAEIAEASLMGGLTMCASTFLNAQQTDYDRFAAETREIVAYVRKHQQPAKRAARA